MTTLDAITLFGLPPADRIQYELAEVDETWHLTFGPEDSWSSRTWDAYDAAISAVWNGGPHPATGAVAA
ncbi:hypothetical protein OHB04_02645 [Streptomyces sp. NBC_01775]|uniref:hypothetical protein n=1 Tax=Streptomyces sp. NBC_01775 TaxID=2975939 RepID=UPI002DD91BB2|nr:hypothetical protein [Streptomyces sp. NBC_01775]WSB74792.1 hypothetical protein OHB04_02645 [Streptomyces sp. NBC_01775]